MLRTDEVTTPLGTVHLAALGDALCALSRRAANGRNPISLVVPCHRVVAADGSLCGYAWGQHRKRWLLEHESSRAFQRNVVG